MSQLSIYCRGGKVQTSHAEHLCELVRPLRRGPSQGARQGGGYPCLGTPLTCYPHTVSGATTRITAHDCASPGHCCDTTSTGLHYQRNPPESTPACGDIIGTAWDLSVVPMRPPLTRRAIRSPSHFEYVRIRQTISDCVHTKFFV